MRERKKEKFSQTGMRIERMTTTHTNTQTHKETTRESNLQTEKGRYRKKGRKGETNIKCTTEKDRNKERVNYERKKGNRKTETFSQRDRKSKRGMKRDFALCKRLIVYHK